MKTLILCLTILTAVSCSRDASQAEKVDRTPASINPVEPKLLELEQAKDPFEHCQGSPAERTCQP